MAVREKGYHHWSGQFLDRRFPWWPITRLGIVLTFRRKFFKFVFGLSLIPAVVYIVGIYIAERLEDFQDLVRETSRFLDVSPKYFHSYLTAGPLIFMIVMIMVFCGAGLIADDLKHNALQLYFARPIRMRDYIIGKAATIFFFILLLTFVPGMVFLLMKLLFSGNLTFLWTYPWLPLSVIVYSFLLSVFFSAYTLLISSLSRNRRYASIMIFAVYFFSDVLFGIFYGIFRAPEFALFSLKSNLQQVGAFLLGVKPAYDVPWPYSLLVLAAVCVLAGSVLARKVKGVSVVR